MRLAYCRDHNGNLYDISARFAETFKCSGINWLGTRAPTKANGEKRCACHRVYANTKLGTHIVLLLARIYEKKIYNIYIIYIYVIFFK